MLGVADVAGYLLERKLLSPRAVVDGGLRVVDASRLNRVFVVTAEHERCFVLKLAGAVDDTGVAHEAAVLERLRSPDPGGGLASCLPEVVTYDSGEGVLILEATPGARDLVLHHRLGRFSVTLAREAGRALGMLHSVPSTGLDGLPTFLDPGWRRGMHRPDLAEAHSMSTGALDLIALVQGSDELCCPARRARCGAARGVGHPRRCPLGQLPGDPWPRVGPLDAIAADRLGDGGARRPCRGCRRVLR